jgi:hypothetical protein
MEGNKNCVKKRVGCKSILSLKALKNLMSQVRSWVEKHITIFNLKFKLQRGLANTENNKRSTNLQYKYNSLQHVSGCSRGSH